MTVVNPSPVQAPQLTLLCVDDEQNILNSMKRLLRKQPFNLLTASSGEEALKVMQQHKVNIIVSDMRMPNMSGAELLEKVAKHMPNSHRILLTGYADMESTIAAVNKGKIHRYLQKPWDNDELIDAIQEGVERITLKSENLRLQKKVAEQNKLLKTANQALEDKVNLRTKQIRTAMHRIEQNNHSTQNMLFNFIAINPNLDASLAKNTGVLCGRIAQFLNLEKQQVRDIRLAGELFEIGALGLDSMLTTTPFHSLNYEQQKLYLSQINMAQMILSPAQHMQAVTEILINQFEHANGSGYPNKLTWTQIPIGAQILAVARDYYRYATGKLSDHPLEPEQIRIEMQKARDTKYVGEVLDILLENPELVADAEIETGCAPCDLKSGMVLKHNLYTENNMLILSAGHVFNEGSIAKLRAFEHNKQQSLSVVIVKKLAE